VIHVITKILSLVTSAMTHPSKKLDPKIVHNHSVVLQTDNKITKGKHNQLALAEVSGL